MISRCSRWLALPVAFLSIAALAEPGGSYGNSRFRSSESYQVTTVDSGPRKGWEEYRWSVSFGSFGFSVTQRIDPETEFPPSRRTWGDSFFGVRGHKEKAYFSGNWSPWTFLEPRIRLAGMDKSLPSPTLYGRCEFAGIRERSPDRVVAEALFRDTVGGWTRVRFSGLKTCPGRFGVAVVYEPPEGKAVESIAWAFVCQPHDYSNRDFWQRTRAVTTRSATFALPDKAAHRFLPGDGPWLFHNRGAHLTSGTFLDRPLSNVSGIVTQASGNTIVVELASEDTGDWVRVICGDWVGEHWRLRGERLLTEDRAERDDQTTAFFALLPGAPALSGALAIGTEGVGDIVGNESPAVRAAYTRYRDILKLPAVDTAPNLVQLAVAKAALEKALIAYRTEWVTAKRWLESGR